MSAVLAWCLYPNERTCKHSYKKHEASKIYFRIPVLTVYSLNLTGQQSNATGSTNVCDVVTLLHVIGVMPLKRQMAALEVVKQLP